MEVDASGEPVRIIGTIATKSGSNLYLTIDSKIQIVAQDALKNYRGAAVVIDPNNAIKYKRKGRCYMKPVGPLMWEHRLIEKMLASMMAHVDKIEKSKKGHYRNASRADQSRC